MPLFSAISTYTPGADCKSMFRAQLEHDIEKIFTNPEEFGESRTVRYDGETYEDISIVLDEGVEIPHKNYKVMRTDYSKGLVKGTARLYCSKEALGGHQPEVGEAMAIESQRSRGFWHRYTVEESGCEEGMLTLFLKKVEE